MFEVGNTLREARMRRGLDIVDCESGTKIRGKYLRALEEEQFDALPGPTFVRGFLRTYSDFLGLDGRLVLEEYETRFERPKELSAHEEAMRRHRSRRRSRESRLLGMLAIVGMAASVGTWIATATTEQRHAPLTPAAAPQGTVPSLELQFKAVDQATTVEAWNSEGGERNRVLERITLTPGAAERLITAPPVLVHIGRPGSVRLTVDGSTVMIPSRATQFEVRAAGDVVVSR